MSSQYGDQGETSGSSANAGMTGQTGSAQGESDRQEGRASDFNLGSARSDYGDLAYGGSLDERGLGGKGYDDFDEGRERAMPGRSSSSARKGRRSARTGGYTLASTGSTGLTLLAGMVAGAALMYFFDPQQGGRRRALMRDKLVKYSNDTADVLGKTSRDLRNRAQGLIAETTKAMGLGGREIGNAEGGNSEGQASGQQASAASASGQ